MSDKALLKAAGIIGIVLGIICCLFIVGLIWGIPMIIGGYKLYDYSNMPDTEVINYKSSILGWSIFFVFFSFISGILGLIYYIGLTSSNNKIEKIEENDYMVELENLKKLYDDKILTQEEYENKKKEILERI